MTKKDLEFAIIRTLGSDLYDKLVAENVWLPKLLNMAVEKAFIYNYGGPDVEILRRALRSLNQYGHFNFRKKRV